MAVQRRIQKAEELNLVPIMNLVTILIPFLIMAAQFVQLAVIDSTLPAIGAPQPQDEEVEDEERREKVGVPDARRFHLSVAVAREGGVCAAGDCV